MKDLKLILKGKWYRLIESGVKGEEYRDITPYWCNRLLYNGPLGVKPYWNQVLSGSIEEVNFLIKQGITGDNINLNYYLCTTHGLRDYKTVTFYLGYAKDRPSMTFELNDIRVGYGNPEWGAPTDKEVFILKLGNRLC